jgi:arginine-tRNA-protein transferase
LTVLPPHPCSYLPGRVAQNRGFLCSGMPALLYQELMDAGFRRSGTFFYQPICRGCRECRPIRVPVGRFEPSKSQRRTWRRNLDLLVTVGAPAPTDEKFDLYTRYLRERHRKEEADDPAGFVEFLYHSPVDSLEITYREPGGRGGAGGRLIGVGICDVCPASLSSVYFYFDPAESRRGLGTFSSLWEIDFARRRGIPYYYLGFWIRDCAAMAYKANYRPAELLDADGVWRPAPAAPAAPAAAARNLRAPGRIVG